MKAKIFPNIVEANEFMERPDITVDHIDIKTVEHKGWVEEKIIVYYTEKRGEIHS